MHESSPRTHSFANGTAAARNDGASAASRLTSARTPQNASVLSAYSSRDGGTSGMNVHGTTPSLAGDSAVACG